MLMKNEELKENPIEDLSNQSHSRPELFLKMVFLVLQDS